MTQASGGSVRIVCGANVQDLEGMVGLSVSEVRSRLAELMNIPSPAQSIIGGRSVDDGYVLQEGE